MFCIYFKVNPLPATAKVLTWFAQFLARSMQTVDSIRNYISGVKLLHLFLGLPCEAFSCFEVKLALKGLARLKPHRARQPMPITPKILLKMYQFLDMNSHIDIMWWALFTLTFFLMARKSNMVPVTPGEFDGKKQLTGRDILIGKKVVMIHLKWSKTNQFGQRSLLIPLVSIPGSPLCPVTAVKKLRQVYPTGNSEPIFILPKGQGNYPVIYKEMTDKLRSLLGLAGFNPKEYSSHSFRRGSATFAFAAGVPPSLIQLQGDWVSDSYLRYLEFKVRQRAMVGRQMRFAILGFDP